MSIKAIFLDFYGTVVHEDEEVISIICNRIKASSKSRASISQIGGFWWNEFRSLFTESYGNNFRTQRELERISLRSTLSHFSSSETEGELSELMFNHWMKPTIFEDAVEFFNNNTLPIYILSNIDRLEILSAMKHHNLEVAQVITSEDVLSYKPRPEMFKYVLKNTGLSFEDVIHIGDSLSSDIMGAQNVGIKAVWINRTNKEIQGNIIPDFTVDNLNDTLQLEPLTNPTYF